MRFFNPKEKQTFEYLPTVKTLAPPPKVKAPTVSENSQDHIERYYVKGSAYHDQSTKGFKHILKRRRHDCWRGDVQIFKRVNGCIYQIKRIRKRFKTIEEAREFAWTERQRERDRLARL